MRHGCRRRLRVLTGAWIETTGGERLGPYDLVIAADGARSVVRESTSVLASLYERYPWGALWAILDDPAVARRPPRPLTGLPLDDRDARLPRLRPARRGTPQVSLFWSVPIDRLHRESADLDAWKADVRRAHRAAPTTCSTRSPEPGRLLPRRLRGRRDAPPARRAGSCSSATPGTR